MAWVGQPGGWGLPLAVLRPGTASAIPRV